MLHACAPARLSVTARGHVASARSHAAASAPLALRHASLAGAAAPLLPRRRSCVVAAVRSDEPGEPAPKPAKAEPAMDDEPPWVRRERERELQAGAPQDLPFGVYLLMSVIVAIAATGSIYEFTAGNAIFGVLSKDSVLYAPILGIFVFTGFPLSAYLFTRCVAAANADAERMDKLDGL